MAKKIAYAVLVLVVIGAIAFLGIAMKQPDTYQVQRMYSVHAVPSVVYAQLVELKHWAAWSPWQKRDPNMELTFSEPSSGVNATMAWMSKSEGKGKQTIVEAKKDEYLKLKLEFIEPWAGNSEVDFKIEKIGPKESKVIWTMYAKNESLIAKFFCGIMDMDKLIGKDFEEGLANLSRAALATPASN